MCAAPARTLEADTQPVAPAWHTLSRDEAFSIQRVDEHVGLTSGDATSRRSQYGPNRMAEVKKDPRWKAFVRQYKDPMQIVLLAAGILSFYPVKQYGTALVIMGLTLVNAVIGLRQE